MKSTIALWLGALVVLITGGFLSAAQTTDIIVKLKAEASPTPNSRPPAWKEDLRREFQFQPRKLFPRTSARQLASIEVWRQVAVGDTAALLERLRAEADVQWAEINHVYRVHAVNVNDPLFPQQWYVQRIGVPALWETSMGDSSIVVGVIDTGVDYLHEDLQGQLWVNAAEDLNHNGVLDSADINGIDDDGNGYVDDVIGWDFTDAPAFADGGDYDIPDNDPMDEFFSGHGTPVSGIIAAAANNGKGIAGVAPGVRIMALRAGTASGYLEEDDVAEAIVYAVENGARIVNMSFGDVAFSYLLRDVIRYGVERGVLFVASAGNDGNDVFQFPAAYDETIAVGATDFQNNLAGFSSYGVKVDVVAPGQELLSCKIGDNYGLVSGTSFSAPVVSGTLALMWSLVPDATADILQGMLLSSARDLGPPGWDVHFGHGLVQANAALEHLRNGVARINAPVTNSGIARDTVVIIGSVLSANFRSFKLEYGMGTNPDQWVAITPEEDRQVVNDTLAVWDISGLPDTVYTLRLTMTQYFAPERVATVAFRVDRTPPQLVRFDARPMLNRTSTGFLLQIATDDLTRVQVSGLENNIPVSRVQSNYLAEEHFLFLTGDEAGNGQLRITLTNSSSLSTVVQDDSVTVNSRNLLPVELKNRFYPQYRWETVGYLLPEYTDFDADGQPEIVFSRRTDSTTFGPLVIAELQGEQLAVQMESPFPGIPRDVADVDGIPGEELLAGYGKLTYILRRAGDEFPREVVWYDTTDFWGSRFLDVTGDGKPELLAIHANQWSVFRIETNGGFRVEPLYGIANPTPGNNQYGVPWCVIADFDEDGVPELVFGDYDGDVMWARKTGTGEYGVRWFRRLEGKDATTLLQAGDVDGDGVPELIAVSRVQPDVVLESNFNAQYWVLSVWKYRHPDSFVKMATVSVQGVNTQRGIFNGLRLMPLPGQTGEAVLFAAYPHLYQFMWQDSTLMLTGFYRGTFNTNTLITGDADANGHVDILLATAEGFQLWEDQAGADHVYPPYGLTAVPLDTSQIQLQWQSNAADYFNIYRAAGEDSLQWLDSVRTTQYLDTTVRANVLYRYAVSAVQLSGDSVRESPLSMPATAVPNPPPTVKQIVSISPGLTAVVFSEPMADNAFQVEHYHLSTGVYPSSVTRADGRTRAILGWEHPLSAGDYSLTVSGITDIQGTPLVPDSLQLLFTVSSPETPFYAEHVLSFSKTAIRLRFNLPVEVSSATDIANYQIEPECRILSIRVEADSTEVTLVLDGKNRIGSLGEPYYLTVQHVRSRGGVPLAEPQTFPLVADVTSLDNVQVFPNPITPQHENELLFGNLPPGSEIFIYTASGRFIRHLRDAVVSGGMRWDLTNEQGRAVTSGVYVYVVQWNGKRKTGKFLVIR